MPNRISNSNTVLKGQFYVCVVAVFALLIWAYSNHFHNPFQFDDTHTILTNNYIKSLKNIPHFFRDARTTSSLPANQVYRPGLTILNTIDYWIGGKAEPESYYFHRTIFICYVILGVVLFFFFLKIFNLALSNKWNKYFALFAAAFFCLHTANAETINYIIARSDSFSTLMIVLAFLIYMYNPGWVTILLSLIPVAIGLSVKEPVVMFGPLLFIYVVLFVQELSLKQLFQEKYRLQFFSSIKFALPAILFALIYFCFYKKMMPLTFDSGQSDWKAYFITQSFVLMHYINNFILPVNLSADTDWELIHSIFDDRILISSFILFGLILTAVACSGKKSTRPVTFGILWFFLALFPTSSIFPFSEVLNDHRPFFPYIGLVMASVWSGVLLIHKYKERLKEMSFVRNSAIGLAVLFLCAHAYGTHHRNQVWNSEESLWLDVTVKSPKNGRGLMNYGNSLMAKGNYPLALNYYERALKILPDYSYLYINLGVLKGATGNAQEAEQNFTKALSLSPGNPECYYYYARWLVGQERFTEAKEILAKGLAISSEHVGNKQLFAEIAPLEAKAKNAKTDNVKFLQENPSPDNFVNLSLIYYKQQQYEKCIEACLEAIKLKPDYAIAWNNLCSTYAVTGEYDKAIRAGKEAIRIQPDFELAKNNLKDALTRKSNASQQKNY